MLSLLRAGSPRTFTPAAERNLSDAAQCHGVEAGACEKDQTQLGAEIHATLDGVQAAAAPAGAELHATSARGKWISPGGV